MAELLVFGTPLRNSLHVPLSLRITKSGDNLVVYIAVYLPYNPS